MQMEADLGSARLLGVVEVVFVNGEEVVRIGGREPLKT